MRRPSFLSRASASGASEIGAYDMQPFAYIQGHYKYTDSLQPCLSIVQPIRSRGRSRTVRLLRLSVIASVAFAVTSSALRDVPSVSAVVPALNKRFSWILQRLRYFPARNTSGEIARQPAEVLITALSPPEATFVCCAFLGGFYSNIVAKCSG